LKSKNIFPRRYFYPSVNTYSKIYNYIWMPISEDIAKRILCLPLYWKLGFTDIDRIAEIIRNCPNN